MDSAVYAKKYLDLRRLYPLKRRLRSMARDTALFFLSLKSRKISPFECIYFPCYHHVLDDEKKGFERQILFLKNIGEFISLNHAVELLREKKKIGGRYFCITFDDGFKNFLTNAKPILHENSCPGAIFIPTSYIGSDLPRDRNLLDKFYSSSKSSYPRPLEFLSWEDCRQLLELGTTIGSHTCDHVPLKHLKPEEIKQQLRQSKETIEARLGITCRHFACPWGRPDLDFRSHVDPEIAQTLGYDSFLTTERGPNCQGQSPYHIRRDPLLAGSGNYQLRYFFSKSC